MMSARCYDFGTFLGRFPDGLLFGTRGGAAEFVREALTVTETEWAPQWTRGRA